jgi:antitoxin (DNA-binding transcriptional repressor) of toxin-antitoxin stability system
MDAFDIRDVPSHLDQLLKRVAAGEEILLIKEGKPVAQLVPPSEGAKPRRKPGAWKGKVWISPDFDKANKEIEALFYDSPIEPGLK